MRSITMLAAVLLSSMAFAQAPPSKPLSPFEQELVNNQNRYVQAFAEKDTAYVTQAIADDFKGIGTNGDFYDKEELVGASHWGLSKDVRAYDVEVVKLTDDSAVVTYNLIVPGSRPRYRHMSDTWARVNGNWKLKFQQYTPNLWSATDFD